MQKTRVSIHIMWVRQQFATWMYRQYLSLGGSQLLVTVLAKVSKTTSSGMVSAECVGVFRCMLHLAFVLQYPFCFYKMVLKSKYWFFAIWLLGDLNWFSAPPLVFKLVNHNGEKFSLKLLACCLWLLFYVPLCPIDWDFGECDWALMQLWHLSNWWCWALPKRGLKQAVFNNKRL